MRDELVANRIFAMAGLVTALLAFFVASSAHSAVISWGSPTNISGDSDVSTNGSLVGARNIGLPAVNGMPAVSTTTVNGVTFTALELGATGNSVTSGNFNLSIPNAFGGNNAVGSALAPFSNLSAAYRAMLGTEAGCFIQNPGCLDTASNSTTPITLTISGLLVGQQYEFEWWKNVSNGFQTHITTATAGNTVSLSSNTSGGVVGGIGQFAIGTFIADAPTQIISFGGSIQNTFNGFQLRSTGSVPGSVPEPGTLALVGFGLAGLAAARRRK